MTKYCLGFMIIRKQGKFFVVLIRKTHPPAQEGLLNGVGGVIRGDENSHEAMTRECLEEIGVYVPLWKQIYQINTDQYSIDVYYKVFEYSPETPTPVSITDEVVGIYPIDIWKETVQDVPYFLDLIREGIANGN